MICQVKRIFVKQCLIRRFFRFYHIETPAKVLYPLDKRGLLKISGDDAGAFLQGLITNDMRHFEEGNKSMYAMFLNNKGRVLYDTLIHKWDKDNSFMVECDKSIVCPLQKHLKLYKLKRNLNIGDMSNEFKLWAFICNTGLEITSNRDSSVSMFKDPRITDLGFRVIAPIPTKQDEITDMLGTDILTEDSDIGYKYLRYKLGVSEGAEDLPPGSSFPLEANCDYLHGVSFHKGCYIGQELTARVHHTGVVRKRLMPIKFTDNIDEKIDIDTTIIASNNPKLKLGKLKGNIQDSGLALVRIKESMEAESLIIDKYSAHVVKPYWWPLEAPKDKAQVSKTE